MAGSLSEAERIDALAEPEAKWDQDTYGMKQAGMRPREQDSDAGRRSILRLADKNLLYYRDSSQSMGSGIQPCD